MKNAVIILMCVCIIFTAKIVGNHERRTEELEKQQCTQHIEESKDVVLTTCKDYDIPDWIDYCASIKSLEPSLIYAIIETESNWNATAVSTTHDYGLMQIHDTYWSTYFKADPDTITNLKVPDDPLDPYANILAGCNALAYWKNICQAQGATDDIDYINCYNKGFDYFTTLDKSYSDLVLANVQETKNVED